jgi:hypothetical protein
MTLFQGDLERRLTELDFEQAADHKLCTGFSEPCKVGGARGVQRLRDHERFDNEARIHARGRRNRRCLVLERVHAAHPRRAPEWRHSYLPRTDREKLIDVFALTRLVALRTFEAFALALFEAFLPLFLVVTYSA